LVDMLADAPHLVRAALTAEARATEIARLIYECSSCLYLGRGINVPLALEGALKLKEVSYIHAEGYPAGEMKHGPIALIDGSMPVVAIALDDGTRDKMLSNIEQVRARDGIVVGIVTESDGEIASKCEHVLALPR